MTELDTQEVEVWKDLVGYEQFHLISNFGNIRTKDRIVNNSKGTKVVFGRQLKPVPNKYRGGYIQVGVTYAPGKYITKRLHRLVALTFIPNPDNKPQINHKNADKSNNRVSNLEWATAGENTRHAFALGLHPPYKQTQKQFNHITQLNNKHITPVVALDKNGKLLKIFRSQREAGRYYNSQQIWVRAGEKKNYRDMQFLRVTDYILS